MKKLTFPLTKVKVVDTIYSMTKTDGVIFLNLSLPVPRQVGDTTDPHSNSNISKTVIINFTFTQIFFEEYSINFLIKSRLIDFALVVVQLLMFKIYRNIGISKIEFFSFLGLKGLNKVKKKQKHSKHPNLVRQSILK